MNNVLISFLSISFEDIYKLNMFAFFIRFSIVTQQKRNISFNISEKWNLSAFVSRNFRPSDAHHQQNFELPSQPLRDDTR